MTVPLAERLARLMQRKPELAKLGIPLTERRALVLLLAYRRAISVRDLSLAAVSLAQSPYGGQLHRLRYRSAAYGLLRGLVELRVLMRCQRRVKEGSRLVRRVFFRVRRGVRDKIGDIIREIMADAAQ